MNPFSIYVYYQTPSFCSKLIECSQSVLVVVVGRATPYAPLVTYTYFK